MKAQCLVIVIEDHRLKHFLYNLMYCGSCNNNVKQNVLCCTELYKEKPL